MTRLEEIKNKIKNFEYCAALEDLKKLPRPLSAEEDILLERVEIACKFRRKMGLEDGQDIPPHERNPRRRSMPLLTVPLGRCLYFAPLYLPLFPIARFERDERGFGHPVELTTGQKIWRAFGITFCLVAITCYMILWVI
ncbi:MAG: hypothetical protein LBI01_01100 [Elusimicrobium sp.]|jgi:hypothetical protein|nr:hypothetical protein [Elusimicrobium sp.]